MYVTRLRSRAILLAGLVLAGCTAITVAQGPDTIDPTSNNIQPVIVTTTTALTTTTTVELTTTTTTTEPPAPTAPPADYKCPEWADTVAAAGFPTDEIGYVLRIMERESTCHPDSWNKSDPVIGSMGLMQINTYWCWPTKYNPNGWLQAQGILTDCHQLFDPVINLRAALAIRMRQGDYGAWGM